MKVDISGDSFTRTSGRIQAAWLRRLGMAAALAALLLVEPALAQSTGEAFCQTAIADTVRNVFTIIQYGGPLLGGVIALGATVLLPTVRRSDRKAEVKEMRTQAILYGVIAAPLGTVILSFLLNNVVAGGTSCSF
ncbi:hypothetical protein [Halarchaeum grantii]|nr:hypothetical protein [Halarchaeum grantii]